MAINALQASQLSTLLAGHAKMFTANNPGQNEFADYLLRSGQAATMGLLAEEEEKKRKKKEKGLLGGKIGSALGTAAGIALAPATGGASMALAGKALQGVRLAGQAARAVPYATGILQGVRGGGQEAEQYGMEGAAAYGRALAGGAIEGLVERLP